MYRDIEQVPFHVIVENPSSVWPILITAAVTLAAAFGAQLLVRSFSHQNLLREKLESAWRSLLDAQMHFSGAAQLYHMHLTFPPQYGVDYFSGGNADLVEGIKAFRKAMIPLDLYFHYHLKDLDPAWAHVNEAVEELRKGAQSADKGQPEQAERLHHLASQAAQAVEDAMTNLRRKHRRLLRVPLPYWLEKPLLRCRYWMLRLSLWWGRIKRRRDTRTKSDSG